MSPISIKFYCLLYWCHNLDTVVSWANWSNCKGDSVSDRWYTKGARNKWMRVETSTKVGELCFKCSQESQWRCKLWAKVLILTDLKFSKQKSSERNCFYKVLIQFSQLYQYCHNSIMLQRYKCLYQQALPDFLRSAVSRDLCE